MTKIYPKCINGEQSLAISATGYLLPCCWWDKPNILEISNLFKEKFKIENVESIEQILKSAEWINFYSNLKSGTGPKICQVYCSKNKIIKGLQRSLDDV